MPQTLFLQLQLSRVAEPVVEVFFCCLGGGEVIKYEDEHLCLYLVINFHTVRNQMCLIFKLIMKSAHCDF